MAKIPYSKLNAKINDMIVTIPIEGYDNEIEVRQYLPCNEKLTLIGQVLELAHDPDNNFGNPIKLDIYLNLKIIEFYTNITFTDKQREDVPKLYDQLYSSGWLAHIVATIPEEEIEELREGLKRTVKSYYKYRNSILGILDLISQDYSDLDFDITELQQKMKDPENLGLIRQIVEKMG